jgi:hypothetical protein
LLDRDDKLRQGGLIRISELVPVNDHRIQGYAFVGCEIHGPALLGFGGTWKITDCDLGVQSIDVLLWEIAPARDVVGPILILDCAFDRCTFRGIGFVGPPFFIEQMRQTSHDRVPPSSN